MTDPNPWTPDLIRRLRLHLALTQQQMATTLGVTTPTVSRWENGHTQPSQLAKHALDHLERTDKINHHRSQTA